MHNMMTFTEMQSAFDGEWVLVGDPEVGEGFQVTAGQVICHSKDRDEVYRRGKELQPKSSAILYLGEFPVNAVIVL